MTLHWFFAPFYASTVLLLVGLLMRDWRGTFAASVLLADWAAATWIANVTGTQFQWSYLTLVDCAAAWLLVIPHRRMEAILAGTFVLEVIAHIAYGAHVVFSDAQGDAETYYWWTLFSIACGQCVFLGWGIINGGGRKHRKDHRARVGVSDWSENPVCIKQGRGS